MIALCIDRFFWCLCFWLFYQWMIHITNLWKWFDIKLSSSDSNHLVLLSSLFSMLFQLLMCFKRCHLQFFVLNLLYKLNLVKIWDILESDLISIHIPNLLWFNILHRSLLYQLIPPFPRLSLEKNRLQSCLRQNLRLRVWWVGVFAMIKMKGFMAKIIVNQVGAFFWSWGIRFEYMYPSMSALSFIYESHFWI